MALKYVDDFEFPPESGFTGSEGKTTQVRPHSRTLPLHDQMRKQGERMGFKYGGAVKDTSREFMIKHKKMDSMDNALTQRKKSMAADERTAEFGDQGPVKPGFRHGGKAKKKMKYMKGGHHPKGKGRKPYKDYNEQEGGSGNEDKRYMSKKGGKMKKKYRAGGPVGANEGGALMNYNKGGYKKGGHKAHKSEPMYGK